jgi:RNA polymerase sigma-70 factor (ECF subfamily)
MLRCGERRLYSYRRATLDGMMAATSATLQLTEEQLIAGCRAGDRDVLEQVYNLYGQPIFRHAFFLLGHREEADDVKQETFLRAFQHIGGFRRQCSLHTWLVRICSHLCYERIRKRRSRQEILCDPATVAQYRSLVGEAPNPLAEWNRSMTLETALYVLQHLPFASRELVVLHLIEGRDYDEIAAILGCARGTAKMRVLRATRQLKERVLALLREGG